MMKVDFSAFNAAKCLCPSCPVEVKSACSIDKMKKSEEKMKRGKMPSPKEVAVTYCGGGPAACKDLNINAACICGDCPVFTNYELATGNPVGYYCKNGKPK